MKMKNLVRSCVLNFTLVLCALGVLLPLEVSIKPKVSKEGLMIHYSFDKATISGTDIKDLSGNSNDGVIKVKQKTFQGKVAEGMQFAGAEPDYIAVKNHHYSKANVAEFTILAWVKAPSRGMIASWDRSEFFRFGVGDDQLGNNDFVAFDTCCPITDWHGETKITDDKWHHVVASYNRGKQLIFVDGKLDAEKTVGHKLMGKEIVRYGYIGTGSEAATFGAPTGPTWAFKGIMDEFMLFHRSLTADEVAHLATGPAHPFQVGTAVNSKDKIAVTWARIKDRQ